MFFFFGGKTGKKKPAQKTEQIVSGVDVAVKVIITKVMPLAQWHERDVGQCTSSSQSNNKRHPLEKSPAQSITTKTTSSQKCRSTW